VAAGAHVSIAAGPQSDCKAPRSDRKTPRETRVAKKKKKNEVQKNIKVKIQTIKGLVSFRLNYVIKFIEELTCFVILAGRD
jgi:hypothetical protein